MSFINTLIIIYPASLDISSLTRSSFPFLETLRRTLESDLAGAHKCELFLHLIINLEALVWPSIDILAASHDTSARRERLELEPSR